MSYHREFFDADEDDFDPQMAARLRSRADKRKPLREGRGSANVGAGFTADCPGSGWHHVFRIFNKYCTRLTYTGIALLLHRQDACMQTNREKT